MPSRKKGGKRMADVTKPEDEKTTPANGTPTDEKNTPAPETEKPAPTGEQLDLNSETPPPDTKTEAAAQVQENEADKAQDKPAPGDNVVTYDFKPKNQGTQEAEQGTQDKTLQDDKTKEQTAQGKKPQEAQTPDKPPTRRGRPPQADKGDNPSKTAKGKETDKPAKGKRGGSIGGGKSAKSAGNDKLQPNGKADQHTPETPPPPPEPKEAPRPAETEKIVYISLSELHPFKDHPFQVKQDAEMAAMVESVKDKGVTQPAIVLFCAKKEELGGKSRRDK